MTARVSSILPLLGALLLPSAAWGELEVPETPPLTESLFGFSTVEGVVELGQVLASVRRHHPMILASQAYVRESEGKALGYASVYDTEVSAKGESVPLGYYNRSTVNATVTQLTPLRGLSVYGGYRAGVGDFPDYYGEYETGSLGEWRAGLVMPLLEGGAIDPERAALMGAELGVEAAGYVYDRALLSLLLEASEVYWGWVAAAQALAIERHLLQIALDRDAQLRARVDEGDLPSIEAWDNRRLILKRELGVVEAERKFQGAALKLSLYLRDDLGEGIRAPLSAAAKGFPKEEAPDIAGLPQALEGALEARPEIGKYRRELAQAKVELRASKNLLAPQLDVRLEGSKDLGVVKASLEPAEVRVGLNFKVDAQRRKAKGAVMEAEARVVQLENELLFLQEKIEVEVRDALADLLGAWRRVDLAKAEVEAAAVLEEGERMKQELGDSTLLFVNIREQASADAAKRLVQAQMDYQRARALYEAVAGRAPGG